MWAPVNRAAVATAVEAWQRRRFSRPLSARGCHPQADRSPGGADWKARIEAPEYIRCIMRTLPAMLTAALFAAPALAQHRADWMQQAKWGVMNHYLSDWQARVNHLTMTVEQWNKMVDGFDVEALAKELQSIGAP